MYDSVTENGSTLLLSRVLSKVSPDGKGKITYLNMPPEDELKQVPSGIEYERTYVGSAYGEDEECTYCPFVQFNPVTVFIPFAKSLTPLQWDERNSDYKFE